MFWVKSAVVSAVLAFCGQHYDLLATLAVGDAKTAAGVLSQLSGTMLGFVLAALAILTTLGNTTLVANMQHTGHFSMLLKRMFGSVVAFGLVTVAGAALLFVPTLDIRWIYPLIGIAIFSIILLADVCRKLWLVLENLSIPAVP
jgi:hypothetical protein